MVEGLFSFRIFCNVGHVKILTTLGFGDITAVHPFARSLVMMEGLIGQLYPAVVLAKLVTQFKGRKTGDS